MNKKIFLKFVILCFSIFLMTGCNSKINEPLVIQDGIWKVDDYSNIKQFNFSENSIKNIEFEISFFAKKEIILIKDTFKIEDDNKFVINSTNNEPYFTYKIEGEFKSSTKVEGKYEINTGADLFTGFWTARKE